MWTFLYWAASFLMIRVDGVGAAPRRSRRVDGVRDASLWSREPRPQRQPSATARPRRARGRRDARRGAGTNTRREHRHDGGPDAVDAAEKQRERAPPGTLRAAAGGAALGRGRREAGGRGRPGLGAASRASRARRSRRRSRRPSPKLTGTPSTRDGESGHDEKKTKTPHRSSTSTAAKNNKNARRRSSNFVERRRGYCSARTSRRGAWTFRR